MAIRIVRLGSARAAAEGLRIGTVRYPPRGVAKADLARRDFYDVWLPTLAPSATLLRSIKSGGKEPDFKRFARKFRAEMKQVDASRTLDLLAALSVSTALSVGCYCADESQCHRSVLRELLSERAAALFFEPITQ